VQLSTVMVSGCAHSALDEAKLDEVQKKSLCPPLILKTQFDGECCLFI